MSTRALRQFVGTLLVGVFAAYLVAIDLTFTRRAVTGMATVGGSTNGGVGATPGRSGRTFADATIVVEGQPVQGTLRAWYRSFASGEVVPVLYLREAPEALIPADFWQAHFASLVGLALFLVVAAGEGLSFRATLRRPTRSLLGGD